MTDVTPAPFGQWSSPLSAERIASAAIRLIDVTVEGPDTYWIEMRPADRGRYVIVKRTADGQLSDLTPAPFNVRTRVHEYGGGAWLVHRGRVFFTNFEDQRLYVIEPGLEPRALTEPGDLRYADFVVDEARGRLIAVREDHSGDGEAVNELVELRLPLDEQGFAEQRVLVTGHDFVASPRVSPDGRTLAWLTWEHPCMPWDGTTLWRASLDGEGALGEPERVTGSESESVVQPAWSPDGALYFLSDARGWWNLYRCVENGVECVFAMDAEFGGPLWALGLSRYSFAGHGTLVCIYEQDGLGHLARLRGEGSLERFETPYVVFAQVNVSGGRAVFLAGSSTESVAVVELELSTGRTQVLRRAVDEELSSDLVSSAEPISFPAQDGTGLSHALFYAPRNPSFRGVDGELPPLVVMSHGGPTSATSSALKPEIQFWTSRGFAVVDVNYGGSSGYGRAYRDRLKGKWGIVDVDDCVGAALYLADAGRVDRERLVIRGGSAGGYTTLAALVFRDVFRAGASYYGVSDLEALAKHTHKFESRYLDSLVAPYPDGLAVYHERSPVHFTDQLSCPVIFFQGLEDRVVPPDQAECMVAALRAKKLPVAYVAFEGEQHGFRDAANIKRALENELFFYLKVFGLSPVEPLEPLVIDNLP